MRTITQSLLSLVCLLGLGCEEPIDLGQRDGASGGSSSNTSRNEHPGMGGGAIQSSTRAESQCGNGMLEPGEVCDDGNVVSGDGCTADCRKPEETVPAICGNGLLDAGEVCDDGNNTSGDGCSANCRALEPSDLALCGNARLEGAETCDDGNADSGDGCTEDCHAIEAGYFCPAPGTPCLLGSRYVDCGNGIVDATEACDDGNRSDGDGCSSVCQLEAGWLCHSTPRSVCVGVCGDGVVTEGEQCDMGVINGDPSVDCRADCTLITLCGDAIVGGEEECDLGAANGDPSSGCSTGCRLLTTCGNGVADPGEECDLGAAKNDDSYGACRTDCQLSAYCGDAIVNGLEQCDDGVNNSEYGGCASGCHPAGYCGDGNVDVQHGEQCDLGPNNGLGTCGISCKVAG